MKMLTKDELFHLNYQYLSGRDVMDEEFIAMYEQAKLAIELSGALEFMARSYCHLHKTLLGDIQVIQNNREGIDVLAQGKTPLSAIQAAMRAENESSTKQ